MVTGVKVNGTDFEVLQYSSVDFHPEVTRVFHRELTHL
jgi:hypothetical protein